MEVDEEIVGEDVGAAAKALRDKPKHNKVKHSKVNHVAKGIQTVRLTMHAFSIISGERVRDIVASLTVAHGDTTEHQK